MKKSMRILSLCLVAVMLCLTLVSCGKKLSGTYSSPEMFKTGTSFTFDGNNVTFVSKVGGVEVFSADGIYAIEDGKISFDFTNEETGTDTGEETGMSVELKEFHKKSVDFEEKENSIVIGGVEYTKQ